MFNFSQLKVIKFLAAMVLVPWLIPTNSAKAVTIDFDNFSNFETISGDTFSDLGVVFDSSLTVLENFGTLPQSPPNTAANFNDPSGGRISGFFTVAVDFVSVFAGDNGVDEDTVTLLGFDDSNNLVATDTFTNLSAQTLSISGAGITRFEITNATLVAIDNFTFNTIPANPTPVPEKFSLASLLVFGLIGGASKIKRT